MEFSQPLGGEEGEDESELDLLGDDELEDEDLELDFGATNIEGLADLELDTDDDGPADAITMTWAEKRQKKLEGGSNKALKASWEERFDDDPLRSETPTTDLETTAYIPYEKMYVLCGEISSAEMLLKRQEAWVHHCQWVRRNTLTSTDDKKVHIEWEYTRLSHDSIGPTGQVLGIRGNSTADVKELLATEPLFANGGVGGWKLFEYQPYKGDNVTCAITDPFIFIGKQKNGGSLPKALVEEQLAHHSQFDKRVSSMGVLIAVDNKAGGAAAAAAAGQRDEFMIVFNSKTVKGAQRYLSEDPLIKRGEVILEPTSVGPINVQDTDGLHHYMARSFAEARELTQGSLVHFMDPFDILEVEVRPLKNLPNHSKENERLVASLKSETKVPKYIRHNWIERFGSIELSEDTELFQEMSEEAQKIRLTVSESVESDDGVIGELEETAVVD